MREIKFRQFINGKFHYWGYHGQDSFIGPVTPVIGSQQFTGLHDKNGKEIYEGDILQYTDNYNRPITGQVQYLGNGFWIEEKDETHYMPNDREVIGNVYENPDLVGGTQKGLDLDG